jgi:hypothetical protein
MIQADSVHSTPPTNTPIDTTRRRFLAVSAGASVASVGALTVAAIPTATLTAAPVADRIFDLIDIHRKAEAAHLVAVKELDRLERSGDSDHDWITEQPCHDEFKAFDELVAAAATTLPGIFAKVDYLRAIAERDAWMFDRRDGVALHLIESFAASIANISAVRA